MCREEYVRRVFWCEEIAARESPYSRVISARCALVVNSSNSGSVGPWY